MTDEQVQAASHELIASPEKSLASPKKKKASWFRTILWILSMMLLANVVMAIIAYTLHRYKII